MFSNVSIHNKPNQDHSEYSENSIDDDIASIGPTGDYFLESIELQPSQLTNDAEIPVTSPDTQNAFSPLAYPPSLNRSHMERPSRASKYPIEIPVDLNSTVSLLSPSLYLTFLITIVTVITDVK